MSSTVNLDQKELMTKGVSYVAAAVALPDIARLEERVNSLETMVNSLTYEIEKIRDQLPSLIASLLPGESVIQTVEIVPSVSNEIREAVTSYLRGKREAYPSDIADALGISLREVLAVISILKKEKKVVDL